MSDLYVTHKCCHSRRARGFSPDPVLGARKIRVGGLPPSPAWSVKKRSSNRFQVLGQHPLQIERNQAGRYLAELAASRVIEHVLPPATSDEVAALETRLSLPLPASYKSLLQCTRGFWLMGGVIQFAKQHPFVHRFPTLNQLTSQQRRVVVVKGGPWPPPSEGMLCFAEFFMEADGDQVLFDTARGLLNGEYPIMYWAHEGRPPSVRMLAKSFGEFMEECLAYSTFRDAEK
jgi:SMI1 / KNR4 family (SUKH-1)